MLENQFLRVCLSNAISGLSLALLIYSFLLKDKRHILKINNLSMAIMTVVYLVSGCFTSVITTSFAMGRNLYCASCKEKSRAVIAAIVLAGTVLSGAVNLLNSEEELAFIPVSSFLVYSVGLFVTATANQLKAVAAIDAALWIVYDYKNLLILCVFQDVFSVVAAGASCYIGFLERRTGRE